MQEAVDTAKQGWTHCMTGSLLVIFGLVSICTGPFKLIVLFRNYLDLDKTRLGLKFKIK